MEWISVEDRLPEIEVKVLVHNEGVINLGYIYRHTGEWEESSSGMPLDDVTHWMPLPSPPQKPI